VFLNALTGLVTGHLSTPAKSEQPVRRSRQKKV
jgi:hypothetical protein